MSKPYFIKLPLVAFERIPNPEDVPPDALMLRVKKDALAEDYFTEHEEMFGASWPFEFFKEIFDRLKRQRYFCTSKKGNVYREIKYRSDIKIICMIVGMSDRRVLDTLIEQGRF